MDWQNLESVRPNIVSNALVTGKTPRFHQSKMEAHLVYAVRRGLRLDFWFRYIVHSHVEKITVAHRIWERKVHYKYVEIISKRVKRRRYTFQGRRMPLKKLGINNGRTTASRRSRLASVKPAISSLR